MIKILIITDKKDFHGYIVAEALKKKGAFPIIWSSRDFLFDQKSSLHISNHKKFSCAITEFPEIDLSEIEVVWFRRPGIPTIPENVHQDDRELVRVESLLYMRSLWLNIGTSAAWINPLDSYDKANSKACQLREAVKIGMLIPDTLISNDRKEIIEFISKNSDQETIYKQHAPYGWEEKENTLHFYTCKISKEELPSQDIIQLTPGIYQKLIKRAFEVRTTFFGNNDVSIKILNENAMDWRSLSLNDKLQIVPFELPSIVKQQCVSLMQALGIVFGCFDFIVTPSGEYVFLEVNEMGQFLWIERMLPELKLLDSFCDFLISSAKNAVTEPLKGLKNLA